MKSALTSWEIQEQLKKQRCRLLAQAGSSHGSGPQRFWAFSFWSEVMAVALKTRSVEDKRIAQARAREWRAFRRDYLFSQVWLADALHCSRRTVIDVESGKGNPRPGMLRKFMQLKRRHEADAEREQQRRDAASQFAGRWAS
jgi:DNA-binding XRE family transcriptional regulator